jgi:hypothetical protein
MVNNSLWAMGLWPAEEIMNAKVGNPRMAIRVVVWLLGVILAAVPAAAQTAEDLVGTWSIASVTAEQGATTVEPYGSNPKAL